jgi:hypothetical protein
MSHWGGFDPFLLGFVPLPRAGRLSFSTIEPHLLQKTLLTGTLANFILGQWRFCCVQYEANYLFGCVGAMKAPGFIHKLFGVAAIVLACGFVWQFYASAKNRREVERADAAFTRIVGKLAAHRRATGHYPESLSILAFANPTELEMQAAIQRITYERKQSGYKLSYNGASGGYHKSYEFVLDF